MIQTAANLAQGKTIEVVHLSELFRALPKKVLSVPAPNSVKAVRPLAEVEKEHILALYQQLDQNKSQTAKALGIGLNTLRRKLEEYGLS